MWSIFNIILNKSTIPILPQYQFYFNKWMYKYISQKYSLQLFTTWLYDQSLKAF